MKYVNVNISGGMIKFAQKQSHDQRYSAGGSGYGTDGFESIQKSRLYFKKDKGGCAGGS